MSSKWERSFEIAVPLDDVWSAFTDPAFRRKLFAPPPHAATAGRPPSEAGMRILELEPKRLLRWSQERGDLPERAEFTVVFESTPGGSRIKVTRFGFGEGEDADVFSEANGLGWEHGLRDLVLALETGQLVKRHYDGAGRSATGIVCRGDDTGLRVLRVAPGSFGAEVGLERGDRLVRIGGAAIYARSELWLVNALFEPGTELDVEFVRNRELRSGRGRLSPIAARVVGE